MNHCPTPPGCLAPLQLAPREVSCRLQPLRVPDYTWSRVIHIDPADSCEAAVLLLEDCGSPDVLAMPLRALTRPFARVEASFETPRELSDFQVAIARALLHTGMPIAVLRANDGAATRQQGQFHAVGNSVEHRFPSEVRIRFDPPPRSVVEHVRKHLSEAAPDVLERWRDGVRSLSKSGARQCPPIRGHEIVEAARFAKREAGSCPLGPDGLDPVAWPAFEAYAAFTAFGFAQVARAEAVHAVRHAGWRSSAGDPLLARMEELAERSVRGASDLRPGEELVIVRVGDSLTLVARGRARADCPIVWRSTSVRSPARSRGVLEDIASLRGRASLSVTWTGFEPSRRKGWEAALNEESEE